MPLYMGRFRIWIPNCCSCSILPKCFVKQQRRKLNAPEFESNNLRDNSRQASGTADVAFHCIFADMFTAAACAAFRLLGL